MRGSIVEERRCLLHLHAQVACLLSNTASSDALIFLIDSQKALVPLEEWKGTIVLEVEVQCSDDDRLEPDQLGAAHHPSE